MVSKESMAITFVSLVKEKKRKEKSSPINPVSSLTRCNRDFPNPAPSITRHNRDDNPGPKGNTVESLDKKYQQLTFSKKRNPKKLD